MVTFGVKPNFADACCNSTDVLNGDFGLRFICLATMEVVFIPLLHPASSFEATFSTRALDPKVNFFTGSFS